MKKAVVSLEKNGSTMVKKTTKIRRENAPGIIERAEMYRADLLELGAELRLKQDRHSWYYGKEW